MEAAQPLRNMQDGARILNAVTDLTVERTIVEAFVKLIVCRTVTVQKVAAASGQVLDSRTTQEEDLPVILNVHHQETGNVCTAASSSSKTSSTPFIHQSPTVTSGKGLVSAIEQTPMSSTRQSSMSANHHSPVLPKSPSAKKNRGLHLHQTSNRKASGHGALSVSDSEPVLQVDKGDEHRRGECEASSSDREDLKGVSPNSVHTNSSVELCCQQQNQGSQNVQSNAKPEEGHLGLSNASQVQNESGGSSKKRKLDNTCEQADSEAAESSCNINIASDVNLTQSVSSIEDRAISQPSCDDSDSEIRDETKISAEQNKNVLASENQTVFISHCSEVHDDDSVPSVISLSGENETEDDICTDEENMAIEHDTGCSDEQTAMQQAVQEDTMTCAEQVNEPGGNSAENNIYQSKSDSNPDDFCKETENSVVSRKQTRRIMSDLDVMCPDRIRDFNSTSEAGIDCSPSECVRESVERTNSNAEFQITVKTEMLACDDTMVFDSSSQVNDTVRDSASGVSSRNSYLESLSDAQESNDQCENKRPDPFAHLLDGFIPTKKTCDVASCPPSRAGIKSSLSAEPSGGRIRKHSEPTMRTVKVEPDDDCMITAAFISPAERRKGADHRSRSSSQSARSGLQSDTDHQYLQAQALEQQHFYGTGMRPPATATTTYHQSMTHNQHISAVAGYPPNFLSSNAAHLDTVFVTPGVLDPSSSVGMNLPHSHNMPSSLSTVAMTYSKASYQCQLCRKIFLHRFKFNRHATVCGGHRPFKCHICQKGFNQQAHLDTHMKFHMGIRRYRCEVCSKGYVMKGDLIRHLKSRLHHDAVLGQSHPSSNSTQPQESASQEQSKSSSD